MAIIGKLGCVQNSRLWQILSFGLSQMRSRPEKYCVALVLCFRDTEVPVSIFLPFWVSPEFQFFNIGRPQCFNEVMFAQ